MNFAHFQLLLLLCLIGLMANGQAVVVSEYRNTTSSIGDGEWTELLVVTDDTDLRNWTIRDNNSTQTGWRLPNTFSSNPLWNHLRAGTIIVVWHRAASNAIIDTSKNDGYIEVSDELTGYLSGGDFMNIAASMDIVQLRNASGSHVHALAHGSSPDTCYTNLSAPKLNHTSGFSGTDSSVYVSPGSLLSEFNGPPGTTWTSQSSNHTKGLPNVSNTYPLTNQTYWRNLRQPLYASPTLTGSYNTGTGAIDLSWTSVTDPYPSDSTIGYIVLRNTSNSFTDPVDGTSYTNGSSIGSATVLAHVFTSQVLTYTDNTIVSCGVTYSYKVYAFRYYCTDVKVNQNCSAIHIARGRAYNEAGTNTVSVTKPLPVANNITAY